MLKQNKTFQGGLILKTEKQQTDALLIEKLPAPRIVVIPLLQHTGGKPARPMVKTGDHVSMGQQIGGAEKCGSAAVHASVSGTIIAVSRYPFSENSETFAVTIENDGEDEFASPIPYDKTWHETAADDLIGKIAVSGVVDFNGSALPAHEKLLAAKNRMSGLSLILNAMVTEPLVSADYRILIEQTEKVLTGGLICKKITGAESLSIVVNDKNSAVEEALTALLSQEPFKEISLQKLKPKYPQHHEKLFMPLAGRNTLVLGAATAACIRDAVIECVPWFQRVVTIAGPAAGSPKNLLVRLGTPAIELLKAGGVDLAKTKKIVSGGPLSGTALPILDTPVIKSTTALLALDSAGLKNESIACINCGRCVSVCPMRLSPMRLAHLARTNDCIEAKAWHIDECIDCGCCAYVCPSSINLVHYLQYGRQQSLRPVRQKVPAA